MPGNEKNAEAFFVVAVGQDEEIDFSSRFSVLDPLPLSAFLER